MKRLSAVVVNFRTPRATIAAVESLRASARPPDDVIVVENGSGDGSAERLRAALPGAVVLVSAENRGFAAGANIGIREALARGAALVLLVNSDAVLDSGAVAALEQGLTASAHAGIAGAIILQNTDPPLIESTALAFSPRTGRVRLQMFGMPAVPSPVAAIQVVPAVTGCVMLIAAEVFDQIGLLAEDYFWGFEDLDFCLAAAQRGLSTITVGDAVAHHEGSLSIGRQSPRRLYWATRNHLLVLERRAPLPRPAAAMRTSLVVAYNVAHALTSAGVPRVAGLRAVFAGLRDFRARPRPR